MHCSHTSKNWAKKTPNAAGSGSTWSGRTKPHAKVICASVSLRLATRCLRIYFPLLINGLHPSLHHHDLSLFHQLWDDLLLNLARDQVPERPGRREPRAVKRRPKPYPLLTRPRRRYREIVHHNRYRKGMKRNLRALN